MTERRIKWYHGLIALALFAGVMVLERYGLLGKSIWASMIGEVLFALIAVGIVLIARVDFKSVFRFKKIRPAQIAGLILLWRGVFAIEEVISSVAILLFPRLADSQEGLEQMIARLPFLLMFFMIAILPPICEELLFRGPVLRSMDFLKRTWLIIFVNGLVFGIAHGSVIKVFSVSILGMLMAYVTYKTDNIACSMSIHFLNNAYAALITYFAFAIKDLNGLPGNRGPVSISSVVTLGAVGFLVCSACTAPICLYLGRYFLLRPPKKDVLAGTAQQMQLSKNWLFLTGAVGLLICAVGVLMVALDLENILMI